MVSAPAVASVRPGWRIALRRASSPADAPRRWAGRPTTPTIARTTRPGSRRRRSPAPASRSAATGATRVARSAGTRPAATVTSVPTSTETIAVRAANTVPASGSSSSNEVKTASMPLASPRPTASPSAEASSPSVSASASTVPSTCLRPAPTIRRSPSSRVRCATVIDSVLKMVNAPTRIATPPKTSSAMRMIPMNWSSPSSVKRSCAAAVCTCAVVPSAPLSARRTSAAGTPSRPATRIESKPSLAEQRPARCAGRRSQRSPCPAT